MKTKPATKASGLGKPYETVQREKQKQKPKKSGNYQYVAQLSTVTQNKRTE